VKFEDFEQKVLRSRLTWAVGIPLAIILLALFIGILSGGNTLQIIIILFGFVYIPDIILREFSIEISSSGEPSFLLNVLMYGAYAYFIFVLPAIPKKVFRAIVIILLILITIFMKGCTTMLGSYISM